MDQAKFKKITKITSTVLMYAFLVLCILSVAFVLLGKGSGDGAVEILGRKMMIVTTDSMAPCEATDVSGYDIGSIPARSLIIIETVPDNPEEARRWYEDLEEGDVLTFRYVYISQITITHRLKEKEKVEGGYILTIVGDNKESDQKLLEQTIDTSETESLNYVIGKVTHTSLVLGSILSFLRTPVALVLLIIIPCLIIMLLEIMKIARLVTKERRERDAKERAEQEEEISALRRKIAELEAKAENEGTEK